MSALSPISKPQTGSCIRVHKDACHAVALRPCAPAYSLPLVQRYRALFALRNRGGADAVSVLGEVFGCGSALLKHEVAYVMGQMQHQGAAEVLGRVLQVRGVGGSRWVGGRREG